MIGNQLFAIARKMLIDFESSSSINHHLTKGQAREVVVVEEYLKKYLPPKYGVARGEIIDSDGAISKQQDIIIFDALHTMPLFSLNGNSESQIQVPIENVYAVIEVKSSLTNSEIDDAIAKYASVVSLKPFPISVNPVMTIQTGFPAPAGFVFAFSSTVTLESLAVHLKEKRENDNSLRHITSILVLDKGIIQYGDKQNPATISVNPSAPNVSEILTEPVEPGEALLNFTLSLNHVLNSIYLGMPDMDLYLKKSKTSHFDNTFIIPLSLTSEDMSFALSNGFKVTNLKLFWAMRGIKIPIEENPTKMIWDNKLASNLLRVVLSQSCIVDSSGISLAEKSANNEKEKRYYECARQIAEKNIIQLCNLETVLSDEDLLSLRILLIKDYFQSLYDSTGMEVMKMYASLVDGKDAAFLRSIADNIKNTFERKQ